MVRATRTARMQADLRPSNQQEPAGSSQTHPSPAEFREALHDLGVRPDLLSTVERQQLDREGYLKLEGVFTRQQADQMLAENTRLGAFDAGQSESTGVTIIDLQDKVRSRPEPLLTS